MWIGWNFLNDHDIEIWMQLWASQTHETWNLSNACDLREAAIFWLDQENHELFWNSIIQMISTISKIRWARRLEKTCEMPLPTIFLSDQTAAAVMHNRSWLGQNSNPSAYSQPAIRLIHSGGAQLSIRPFCGRFDFCPSFLQFSSLASSVSIPDLAFKRFCRPLVPQLSLIRTENTLKDLPQQNHDSDSPDSENCGIRSLRAFLSCSHGYLARVSPVKILLHQGLPGYVDLSHWDLIALFARFENKHHERSRSATLILWGEVMWFCKNRFTVLEYKYIYLLGHVKNFARVAKMSPEGSLRKSLRR
jgi:hypothetical protein